MTKEQADLLIQVCTLAVTGLGGLKMILGAWIKKETDLQVARDKLSSEQFSRLNEKYEVLSSTINGHSVKMEELRIQLVTTNAKISEHSDHMHKHAEAFQGFVRNNETRLQVVENNHNQLIRVIKDRATRIRGGNGESK